MTGTLINNIAIFLIFKKKIYKLGEVPSNNINRWTDTCQQMSRYKLDMFQSRPSCVISHKYRICNQIEGFILQIYVPVFVEGCKIL